MRWRLAGLVLLLTLSPARAWSGDPEAPHHADLAEHVLALLEPDQTQALRVHLAAYRQGALDADVELAPQNHRYDPVTGNGSALRYLDRAAPAMRENITTRNMTGEDARQLGIIVHVLFDLTQPLHTGTSTVSAPHHAEYEAAAYQNAPKLPDAPRASARAANVTELAEAIARASAARSVELEALLREGGPWSAEIANLTNATLREGTPRVAEALAAILPAPPPPPPTPSTAPSTAPPVTTPSTPANVPSTPASTPPPPGESTQTARETPDPALLAALAGVALGLLVKHHVRARGRK